MNIKLKKNPHPETTPPPKKDRDTPPISVFSYLQSKWLKAIAWYEWELSHVFIILDKLSQDKIKEYLQFDEGDEPHICVFNHCYLQPIKDILQYKIIETHISADQTDHYRLYTIKDEKMRICKIKRDTVPTIRQPINLSINKKLYYINRVWRDDQQKDIKHRYWPMTKKRDDEKNI